MITPDVTGDIDVGAMESTATPNADAQGLEPLHRAYSDYVIMAVVAVALCCCAVGAVFVFCCRNQTKLKRQLTATQHQVTRLKSLSNFEGIDEAQFGAEGAGDVVECAPDGVQETMPPMMVPMGGARSVSNVSNINVALPSMGSNGGHYQHYHSPVAVQNGNFSRQSSHQTVVSAQSGRYTLA